MTTTYDAWGRDVSQLGKCFSCGASIKYIYVHEGKTYGSTCIKAFSGIPHQDYVWLKGRPDEKATNSKIKALENKRKLNVEREAHAKIEGIRIQGINKARFIELINVLNSNSNKKDDFCSSIAKQIEDNTNYTYLYEGILSPRQFEIVSEVWSKVTGGRRGSKKYDLALDEFYSKFDDEV